MPIGTKRSTLDTDDQRMEGTSASQSVSLGLQSAAPARLSYVLITPARNEAAFIENTIKAVVAQTLRPAKWVIVSDGSTDGTDDIVAEYAAEHPWIELVRMPERRERHFAGKVAAFGVRSGFSDGHGIPKVFPLPLWERKGPIATRWEGEGKSLRSNDLC